MCLAWWAECGDEFERDNNAEDVVLIAYGWAFGWMGGRYFLVGSAGEICRLAIAASSSTPMNQSVNGSALQQQTGGVGEQ